MFICAVTQLLTQISSHRRRGSKKIINRYGLNVSPWFVPRMISIGGGGVKVATCEGRCRAFVYVAHDFDGVEWIADVLHYG